MNPEAENAVNSDMIDKIKRKNGDERKNYNESELSTLMKKPKKTPKGLTDRRKRLIEDFYVEICARPEEKRFIGDLSPDNAHLMNELKKKLDKGMPKQSHVTDFDIKQWFQKFPEFFKEVERKGRQKQNKNQAATFRREANENPESPLENIPGPSSLATVQNAVIEQKKTERVAHCSVAPYPSSVGQKKEKRKRPACDLESLHTETSSHVVEPLDLSIGTSPIGNQPVMPMPECVDLTVEEVGAESGPNADDPSSSLQVVATPALPSNSQIAVQPMPAHSEEENRVMLELVTGNPGGEDLSLVPVTFGTIAERIAKLEEEIQLASHRNAPGATEYLRKIARSCATIFNFVTVQFDNLVEQNSGRAGEQG